MFGSIEDPATGSAACALTAYLSLAGDEKQKQTGLRDSKQKRTIKFEIDQGKDIGRPSVIRTEVTVNADGDGVRNITLKGSAVKVMDGTLVI